MRKQKEVKWHQNRSRRFMVGLVVALSCSLWAFSWTSVQRNIVISDLGTAELNEINQIRTPKKEKKVKRVPIKETKIILDNDIEETDIVEVIDTLEENDRIDQMEGIEQYEPGPKDVIKVEPLKFEPDNENEPRLVVELMPYFGECASLSGTERKNCSDLAILRYLQSRIEYPQTAKEIGIQGTVVISFIVDRSGIINDVTIVKDIGAGCGAEAKRIIEEMPAWHPGIQNGKKVPVIFKLPVKFRLR